MDKKTKFRLAAVNFATQFTTPPPRTIKDEFIFKVDEKTAKSIVNNLKKADIIEEAHISGVKLTQLGRHEAWTHEVSRVWDPNAYTITDGRGDWDVKYASGTTFHPSGEYGVEFLPQHGDRPRDVTFGKQGLVIKQWSIETKPLENALNTAEFEENLRALTAFASNAETATQLREKFNRLSKIENLTPSQAVNPKALSSYAEKTKSAFTELRTAIDETKIATWVEKNQIDHIVQKASEKSNRRSQTHFLPLSGW